jgi:ADP-heptose:LPS heptosyltransferase
LIGGKEDERVGDLISSFFQRHDSARAFEEGLVALNKKTIVYNACGKFNDHQKASIVKQSKAVVTFDNEFNAIASAFGKEVVSIWGNTVLDFGRYPYNTKFTVLENNRLHCRPCSRKGYDRCPLGHFRCMNDIVFDFYVG